MSWLWVAAGGALGSMARHGVARLWPATPGGFPVPTLTVNLLGCFAIGVVHAWLVSRSGISGDGARLFWMTGVLGGFTTYSAFALESSLLGFSWTGVVYVLVTLAGCIGGAWLGKLIGAALLAQG